MKTGMRGYFLFTTALIRSICYAQNPVFEIVHDESVKVNPHMYNGNVQQNSLCVESRVTKEFPMSPRFSSTIFDPDTNSVLLRAHLCTAVDSVHRKPCVRNCQDQVNNGVLYFTLKISTSWVLSVLVSM